MKPLGRLGVLCVVLVALFPGCSDRDRNMSITAMNHGIEQYRRGNYNGAITHMQEATRIDPTYGEPYLYMGMIRLQHYDSPEAAITDLERATERMPDDPRPFYLLGCAHLDTGQRQQGEDALERVLGLDPTHHDAWLRLGQYHESNGDIMDAIESYTQTIYADPRSAQGYLHLGDIYARYGYWVEAAAVYQNGLDNSHDPGLFSALGTAYLQQGNIEAAIDLFERAVAQDNRSIVHHFNLGSAFVASFDVTEDPRDREQAIEHLTIAQGRCGALGSQARCNLVNLMLRRLQPEED